MRITIRRGHIAVAAAAALLAGAGVHVLATRTDVDAACIPTQDPRCPVPTNPANDVCGPTIPVDGGTVCGHDARAGVLPEMVANAEAFASCLGEQGVIPPPVVVHDPVSITFVYAPGVVPAPTALQYCHLNAVHVPCASCNLLTGPPPNEPARSSGTS